MDVRAVRPDGVERCDVGDIKALLDQPETIVWIDIPTVDADATRLLSEVFGFHPLAVHDCAHCNPVPKVHRYPDAVLVVLRAPEPADGSHVHYVELDQLTLECWSRYTVRSARGSIHRSHSSRPRRWPGGWKPAGCVRQLL
jgi:Mg2+ and Co2+ transporter CorA